MRYLYSIFLFLLAFSTASQNFTFSFWGSGQRVCLTDAAVDLSIPSATLHFRDAAQNTTQPFSVYRRNINGDGADWALVASSLPAGTISWTDQNVNVGEVWEYQVKRTTASSFAFGYTTAALQYDQSNYRGQMILLVAANIAGAMPVKIEQLKRDLTADGWFVNQLTVPRAYGWDSRDTVLTVKSLIAGIYNNAPANDKPKVLFILGHVPLPRAGLGGQAPDNHSQNAGARGADSFYADIDGVFTDNETYNPGGLSTPLAINLPGDFKWDQDFIPTELEMAFGRLDFADLTSVSQSETFLTERYLDRLHKYRQVEAGWFMGSKSAFYFGFNNSNDGSYRSLLPISGYDSVSQNYTGNPHPQWVQNNGPFAVYMQNQLQPSVSEWNTYGMNATVFSSDQSYWGFSDVPEGNQYSTIRALLALDTRCLTSIWTTMAVNIFHQPGMGAPLGLACKQIMDHNTINQKLEKPVQAYDTPAFWNRTHFAFHGDPTLRLFQVYPPSGAIITSNAQSMLLSWNPSPDSRLLGYHVYKSTGEYGIYQRITTNLITETEFSDPAYNTGDWYMVRAIILQKTGSGSFLNPSQGIFVQGAVSLLGQPGPISGNTTVCAASSQIYSVVPVAGATSYTWTIPVGWSGSSVTNQINIVAGNSSGSISVVANNANGSSQPSSLSVIVSQPPSGPGAISGNAHVCEGANQLYSTAPVNTADFYNWTLPPGWAGTSTSDTINVIAGSVGGTVSVSAGNECGISAPSRLTVNVNSLPASAGQISGPTEICTESSAIYSVSPLAGALSYNWILPEGASGQSSSTSIEVWYGVNAVSGSIMVSGSNDCGEGQSAGLPVIVNPVLAQPGAINGALIVCEGSALTYTIALQSGADFYNWTLPPGWTGTSTSNTINVIAGSVGGTISVSAGNECGISAPSRLTVNVNSLPASAGQISGPTEICTESSAVYSVSPLAGALSYNWILPEGASGQSSSTSIEVWYGVNAVSGSIMVSGSNDCGEGQAAGLPVVVNPVLAQPGAINGALIVCEGSAQTYTIAPQSGADFYNWTLPPGWTGTSTSNTINVIAGSVGGTISVSAGNECDTSTPSQLTVNVNSLPAPAGQIGGPTEVCTESSVVYSVSTVAGALSYNWVLPEGVTGQSSTNTIEVFFGANAVPGLLSVAGINDCGSGNESFLAVDVNQKPPKPIVSVNGNLISSNAETGNQWYNSNGLIAGATGQIYEVLADDYYYTIVTTAACSSDPSQAVYIIVTGFEHPVDSFGFKVYPNPASDHLFIEASADITDCYVEIVNMNGQNVMFAAMNIKAVLDIGNLKSGIYTVRLRTPEGKAERLIIRY